MTARPAGPPTRVAEFHVDFTRFLAPDGTAAAPLPDFFDRAVLTGLYRHMVLTRAFDTKAIALQRTGRLGTYAPSLGQEALAVGVGAAMAEADVLVPSFREHGAQLVRGVTLEELFLFWAGDERGNDFAGPRQDFPVCIPVGSHAPHAAGVALAFKLRHESRAAVCVFGDGATSKGEVYEAMNLAGAWALPVVFVVANNQWAISVRRDRQTAARTLAQKAIAAGFTGEQVDGNDVVAVCHALRQALDHARTGGGPHLVEALTYRLGDHTTADDASRYRDDEEVGRHWKEDPVARLRAHLAAGAGWRRDDEEALLTDCAARVEAAAKAALATAPETAAVLFDHLYATLPPALADQRAALLDAEAGNG